MSQLFKRKVWVDADGKKCKAQSPGSKRQVLPCWYFRVSVDGREKWVKAYSDKEASATLMADTKKRLARNEQGLVDQFKEHNQRPLSEHTADYLRELEATGHDVDNNRVVELRLNKMLTACGWNRLPDITTMSFQRFRDTGKMLKSAPKTRNDYQQTIRQFCRWCVRNGRMAIDPFQNLATIKINGDIRRQRRALTDAEVQHLLTVSPEPRRTVYMTALLTGLRRAELRQIRRSDLHLDAPKPFLTARASTTKNGKDAVIFLRDDLVTALRGLNQAGDENDAAFRVPKRVTFYKDLAAAGIARKDKQKRVVDFHCLRHTLATNLGRSGVSVRTAMEVMRHSDIRLTTKTYTDASLLPTAEALEMLPRWEVQQQEAKATGTDGTPGSGATAGATVGATVYPSFSVASCPNVSLLHGNTDSKQTRMDSGKTCDNQGVAVGTETMRPLGIEPRTHRLKVCCSTS